MRKAYESPTIEKVGSDAKALSTGILTPAIFPVKNYDNNVVVVMEMVLARR